VLHTYHFPTTILFGIGALEALPGRLRSKPPAPVLLVTDRGLVEAGLCARVEAVIERAGRDVVRFDAVHPNPVEADVVAGAARYREAGCAEIVALGGGSPMDTAKVIGVLATHDGALLDFDALRGGDARIVRPLPPLHAIPTTAGTGSEVGRSAVVVAQATGRKTIVFHPRLMPATAVLDPALTVGLPPHLTAATGFDALTHAVEAYLARGHHPMADAIALGAVEFVARHLPVAVAHGDDLDARGGMLVAATMGATAFQKGLGAVHALAHPLSNHYGTHHGLANALLLPGVLAWQLEHRRAAFSDDLLRRYERLARIWEPDARAEDLPAILARFRADLGLAGRLAAAGVQPEDVPQLAAEAYGDPCRPENPIDLGRDDLAAIYRAVLAA